MKLPFQSLRRRLVAVVALGVLGLAGCDSPNTPPDQDPTNVTLVSCPSTVTRTTQAFIGPLGGTLSLGGTTIGIPSGALSSLTLITLTIPASPYMEVDVRANNLLSFVFNRPIGVRIDYSRCNNPVLDAAKLSVWHIDAQSKELLENMGGVDNKSANTIDFSTGHLSNYAIAF
jgi:hypothetical protein